MSETEEGMEKYGVDQKAIDELIELGLVVSNAQARRIVSMSPNRAQEMIKEARDKNREQ